MAEEESARIKKQVEELGESGLADQKHKLDEAMEHNEIPVPKELLKSIPVPGSDSIAFHSVDCHGTQALPLPAIFVKAKSGFVKVWAFMDTAKLPVVC